MIPEIFFKAVDLAKKVASFMVRATVGYLPMMLMRIVSRKINEKAAVQSAQHQREYAQHLASRMKPGPGGQRPVQQMGTHYQPPYYYQEVAYNSEVAPDLEFAY